MKVSLTAVLLLCASTLSIVHAGFDDNDPQRSLAKGNGNGNGNGNANGNGNGNNNDGDGDEEVNLMVKYRNSQGKSEMAQFAKNGVKDIPRFKIASFKTGRRNKNAIKRNPNIESVEEEQTLSVLPHIRGGTEDEEQLTDDHEHRQLVEETPYGITMVQADQLDQGTTKIKVCVVDTGYGLNHPDLPNSSHGVAGTDTGSGIWNVDGHSHGTHCAGTIGAIGGNGVGVSSVNPDPNKFLFHIGKGLSDSGSGASSAVLDAVAGCADAGAKVISMSLGGGSFSQTTNDIYKELYDDGILIIAAAGNGGNAALSYPASYPNVMSVAAVGSNQNKAGFSQYNDQVEIAGPGVSILSTITQNSGTTFGYASYSGTSMATPHVAGVAALVWSHFPDCSNNQIRNVLLRTAIDRGVDGCDIEYGYGIVQAKAAYDSLTLLGCDAGGIDPVPLSGGVGGCEQDPDYVPPPTMAPTPFTCGETTIEVELNTDNYGAETSWELTDSSGTVHASDGGYGSATSYIKEYCVPADACTFTINDSFGDGICCSYGSGSYTVRRNGAVVASGGEFASTETTEICTAVDPTPAPVTPPTEAPVIPTDAPVVPPTSPPTEAPVVPPTEAPVIPTDAPVVPPTSPPTEAPVVAPTSPPTEAPVVPPTSPPTEAPVVAPTSPPTEAPVVPPTSPPTEAPVAPPTPCNGMEFELSLVLDNYPSETSWELKRDSDGSIIESGGSYQATLSSCLPNDCYRFTMYDSWGDGLCCGWGEGSYDLTVNGNQLHTGGTFNNYETTLFGTCSDTGAGVSSTGDKTKF